MTKTVSLETAKLLKEAGWPQDRTTENDWCRYKGENDFSLWDNAGRSEYQTKEFAEEISAPDVSELLEALPKDIEGGLLRLGPSLGGDYWFAWYCDDEYQQMEKTPAEALAALWLELRKQKLV